MGTYSELGGEQNSSESPSYFFCGQLILLELQLLRGGSSKLFLKGNFVANSRAVL